MGLNTPSPPLLPWAPSLAPRPPAPFSRAPSLPLLCSSSLPSLGVRFKVWIFETLYWDWSGKEAQSSLCPSGFWIQFNLVRFVLCFGWIRFSFDESWARDDEWFYDDRVTLCSDSNTPNLVLIPLESRGHSNRSSCRSKENPRFCSEFFDSSQTMEWFVDSFREHVHKSFVIMPAKFELLWTWFDLPIIKDSKGHGLKRCFWTRTEFLPITG